MAATALPPVREVAEGIHRIDVNHPQPEVTCCYLIVEGDAAALIDCGGGQRGADAVLAGLAQLGIPREQVRLFLVTHAHLDHAGAAGQLMQALPSAAFFAHPSAVKHLVNPFEALVPASQALYGRKFFDDQYGGMQAVPGGRAQALADGEALDLNGRRLQAIFTPGHAWHHVSFYDAAASFIVAGDAYGISYRQLYRAGEEGLLAPVTPPSQFNPEAMEKSIRALHGLKAARIGLSHYDVLDAAAYADAYLQQQLQALDEWQRQADGLFAQSPARFAPQMQDYLMEWIGRRAAEYGAERPRAEQLHAGDVALSAAGFNHYLKKKASA